MYALFLRGVGVMSEIKFEPDDVHHKIEIPGSDSDWQVGFPNADELREER